MSPSPGPGPVSPHPQGWRSSTPGAHLPPGAFQEGYDGGEVADDFPLLSPEERPPRPRSHLPHATVESVHVAGLETPARPHSLGPVSVSGSGGRGSAQSHGGSCHGGNAWSQYNQPQHQPQPQLRPRAQSACSLCAAGFRCAFLVFF